MKNRLRFSAGACALLNEPRHEAKTNNMLAGCAVTTYGISAENDWSASSISSNVLGGQDYVLCYKKCQISRVTLQLPGVHNVIATVVTLVTSKSSINDATLSVRNHLSNFKGVSRRFELIGKINGCQIYDDYAHHPTEVRAVLQAA
ncbi:hypothetical protein Cni_G05859 [Canna indica]|uniref:Mur ligase C-terminal domain-containing protein n=1 Tax=Canna indica TaxID=4628 RepID=A0AAQ3JYL4_9LILI|nr:hypothetical protein Cni_G05859 [Canna indica]